MAIPNDPAPAVELRQSLAALIQESERLRTDVHGAEKARKRASAINLGVLGLLVLFVAMLFVVVFQNNQLVKQVNQTNAAIADCTTAGGHCYEQGRARTGDAVGDIIRAELYMAECARLYPGEAGPAFDRKLEQCVTDRLVAAAKQRAAPSASPSPASTPVPSASAGAR